MNYPGTEIRIHRKPSQWRKVAARLAVLPMAIGLTILASPSSAEARPSSVTVHKGDTLSAIAVTLCGSASKYPSLAAGNGIKNPNLIFPGQVVKATCNVRPGSSTASRSAPRATPTKGWVNPLPHSTCISAWGRPRVGHPHRGIDLVSSAKWVVAAAKGTVIFNGYESGGAGWYVKLRHADGHVTVYMHLAYQSSLRIGRVLAAGQIVGAQGASGDAEGRHLHFEVRTAEYGHQINPAPFLRARGVKVGC